MRFPSIPGFEQQAFNKYLKNTGWLMFGKILSMIIGFIIARYLGPYSFGELSFAEAFVTLFAAVGGLGLDSFIIREILHEPENRDEILGTSFWMRITVNSILIPFAVVIYLTFRHFSESPGSPLTWLIALLSFANLFKSFNVIDSYFQSQVQSKFVVQVQNVCLIISAIVKVVFVAFYLPVIYFALALVIDGFLLACGLLYIYEKRNLHLSAWKFKKERAVMLIRQSWPLILSAVMVSIYMKIDVVMLKSLGGGNTQVGIYSAAARISEAWYFIPIAIVTSVFPAIIQAHKTNVEHYKRRLQNLYDLLVVISLPVALLVSFSADYLINMLYGNRFEGAGMMLSIHIWSGIFVFLGSASSQFLIAEGLTMISFTRTAFGAVMNIILNVILIPLYGGIGASIATLIAYFLSTFIIIIIPQTREQGWAMLKSVLLISLVTQFLHKRNNQR